MVREHCGILYSYNDKKIPLKISNELYIIHLMSIKGLSHSKN